MYQATASGPRCSSTVFSRRPMSSSASSQPTREPAGQLAPERMEHPVRVVLHLRHHDPLGTGVAARQGLSGSGRSFVTFPSSTVATIPQSGSQIRQNVTFCTASLCEASFRIPGGILNRIDPYRPAAHHGFNAHPCLPRRASTAHIDRPYETGVDFRGTEVADNARS